jgi:hypothetical protein
MSKNTISMYEKAFWNTKKDEIDKMQEKMDKVSESLNPEQLKLLNEVMDWVAEERVCDEHYNNEQFN